VRVFAVLGCWAAVVASYIPRFRDGLADTELWLLRKLGLESILTSFKASTPPSFRSDTCTDIKYLSSNTAFSSKQNLLQ